MAEQTGTPVPPRSKDEVAFELMKFISLQTGYGKGATGAGFSAKATRTPEEHADALIELFQRCRKALSEKP
jgi:hypothetical protein